MSVTLSWEDPEKEAEFLALRARLVRDGWLPDPSRDALVDLVDDSVIVKDSTEGGGGDGVV